MAAHRARPNRVVMPARLDIDKCVDATCVVEAA